MSNCEGIRNPPPMGVGYAYAMPRHIADLRGEAVKRHNDIEVKQKVNYSGFFSKRVFHIKQGTKQIERALNGQEGATEITIVPNGELMEFHINEYLIIHIEPLSLPHRHDVHQNYVNHLIPEPPKGARPTPITTVRENQTRAKQQPQVQKKKPADEDTSYVPSKRLTIEDKGHETCGKAKTNQKRINLTKEADLEKQSNKNKIANLHRECRRAEEEAKQIE